MPKQTSSPRSSQPKSTSIHRSTSKLTTVQMPRKSGHKRKRQRCVVRHDLNVPMPRSSGALVDLIGRLTSTGYETIALSHTVYGRPDPKKDAAGAVLDESVIESAVFSATGEESSMAILRRLTSVVEELSDIGNFTDSPDVGSQVSNLLGGYDIIAVSPRSDATFASACSTACRADVIVLDYSTGRLPFRIKQSAVRAASQLGIALELCYGSAILEPSKRKTLVRIAIDLQNACRGVRNPAPQIILTSGSRTAAGSDFGALALRSTDDLVNLLKEVLKFSDDVAANSMTLAAEGVVKRCRDRKMGVCFATRDRLSNTVGIDATQNISIGPALGSMQVSVEEQLEKTSTSEADLTKKQTSITKDKDVLPLHQKQTFDQEDIGSESENDEDDGFITFS